MLSTVNQMILQRELSILLHTNLQKVTIQPKKKASDQQESITEVIGIANAMKKRSLLNILKIFLDF